ncbi:MAG: tRNA (5-methylaminomethyl-2-thiouridine)(34)-methyltransferase MnmD [Flavobacteriales bacterium]|jgi:tRNA U34 5-methylaminomethyl-2-thiouridine-forming methyltransferase MnmC|nr:tRNA (5-methylaminomethyl-2-thiouridine)(34)-methyltransferase MnmD [Flavobacteriales bacterium]|tara:strand:+ start:384 stop:1046 length:663 start_codon:yes stop_codon:yes gene_type:complete
MKLKVIVTSDGSKTLQIPEWNEQYHSTHGAVAEAKHVYIKNGLDFIQSKEISIFEMGFGTGLNAFLTYLNGLENKRVINYYAIEKEPLPFELVTQLDYAKSLSAMTEESTFFKLHTCPWEVVTEISTYFRLFKIHDTFEHYSFHTTFDLVYYDAFGFRVQPELWQKEVFEKLVKLINIGGVLVTYCAKGEVKRILKTLGMHVESLAGPPGKREMIRAIRQ